jgi:hypothetical protein
MTYEDWLIGWAARQKARRRRLKLIVAAARIRALLGEGEVDA